MPSRRSHLLDLLTSYLPADPDELEYRARMLDLAAAAPDPFSRHDFGPGHFTASGFVVHPGGDRILLIHHARLGIWVQPGGHIEPGDASPLAAAIREVGEETGLTALYPVTEGLLDVDIHVFPESDDQPRHLHFDLRFGFVGGDDRIRPLDGTAEALWVGESGLSERGVDRSVTRPAAKLLGMAV